MLLWNKLKKGLVWIYSVIYKEGQNGFICAIHWDTVITLTLAIVSSQMTFMGMPWDRTWRREVWLPSSWSQISTSLRQSIRVSTPLSYCKGGKPGLPQSHFMKMRFLFVKPSESCQRNLPTPLPLCKDLCTKDGSKGIWRAQEVEIWGNYGFSMGQWRKFHMDQ